MNDNRNGLIEIKRRLYRKRIELTDDQEILNQKIKMCDFELFLITTAFDQDVSLLSKNERQEMKQTLKEIISNLDGDC